jgi:hypothetical protein
MDADGLQNEEPADFSGKQGVDVLPDIEEQPEMPENEKGEVDKSAW